ncbi:MAG: hypothetical protein ACFB0B_21095 [Thermonemataceae bacterium]
MQNTEFQIFDPKAETTGTTIAALIDAMGEFRSIGLAYLQKHEIDSPAPGKWHPLTNYMAALRLIHEKLGENTLFLVGTRLFKNAWPEEMQGEFSFEQVLGMLNQAYQQNHRNGYAGEIIYNQKDDYSGEVIFDRTYCTAFDRGLLVSLSRVFEPERYSSIDAEVEITLDETKPSRKSGGYKNHFHVTW